MSDDVTTPPAGDEPQTPTTPTPPAGAETMTAPTPAKTAERTYSEADYRAVQNEARNLRTRLREAEQTGSQHQSALEALQADTNSLRTRLAAAEDSLRAYRLRDAIAETARADDAGELHGLDPELAARLLESVEYDEDGQPKSLKTALGKLVKRYPQLAAAAAPRTPAQPAAGTAQRATPSATQLKEQKRRDQRYTPL